MKTLLVTVCAALALAAFAGCKKKEAPKPTPVGAAPAPAPAPAPTAAPTPAPTPAAPGEYEGMDTVADAGTVSGTVMWKGAKPKLEPYPITKDNSVCGKEKPSNRLIVGANSGVQYAVVSLVDIRKGKKIDTSVKPFVDQVACEYVPHVQVVPANTKLTVINSDPILHNVHAYLGTATEFNLGMPIKGQRIDKELKKAGLVDLKCDAGHTWMNAYILVADHPYHAVSDANGAYTIKDVPPGTYKVKMWHEGWKVVKKTPEGRFEFSDPKEVEKTVTVAAKGTATVDFELSE
jgi:hypothetical protein